MIKLISSPKVIAPAGNMPKEILEFIGRVNSNDQDISIAKMKSPKGWEEPWQRPDFDEHTIILRGEMKVETDNGTLFLKAGQAITATKGDRVRYSTPNEETEYMAICIPAFSPDTVNRDE